MAFRMKALYVVYLLKLLPVLVTNSAAVARKFAYLSTKLCRTVCNISCYCIGIKPRYHGLNCKGTDFFLIADLCHSLYLEGVGRASVIYLYLC